MTTKRLTIKRLLIGDPWTIAKDLGLGYTGDMNAIPHGGIFYSTKDWAEYGEAECVRIQESEGVLWVEHCAIDKPKHKEMVAALRSCGLEHEEDVTPEMEIESAMWYCGPSHVGFRYTFHSDNGKDWGEFPEFQIWKAARPLILSLV